MGSNGRSGAGVGALRQIRRTVGALMVLSSAACVQAPPATTSTAVTEQRVVQADACCAGAGGRPVCATTAPMAVGAACVCRVAAPNNSNTTSAVQGTACRVQ